MFSSHYNYSYHDRITLLNLNNYVVYWTWLRSMTSEIDNLIGMFLQALLQALGDRKGIYRFGDFSAPLDEALIHVALVCF